MITSPAALNGLAKLAYDGLSRPAQLAGRPTYQRPTAPATHVSSPAFVQQNTFSGRNQPTGPGIPKSVGGERPIGIFRSAMRVPAKCNAQQARPWLEANSPTRVNAARRR